MRKYLSVLCVGLSVLVLAGCAEPPALEIDQARAAVSGAETAQAAQYAPDALRAARDAQAQLDAELKAQEERFALMRSYDKAKELAAAAQASGEKAAADARAGKERARQEASSAISAAQTSLAEVKVLLDQAPTGKGTAADLAAMRGDLAAVDEALIGADSSFAAEKFAEAKTAAEAAMQTVEATRAEIEQAIAATKGRRR